MNSSPILTSSRLVLKPLGLEHLSEAYVQWMNDGSVTKYLESGGDYTIEKLSSYLKEQESKEVLFWAIHLKEGMKHIGNIKIDPIDKQNNSGEYGIMMGDTNEWGKGYGEEATILVIDFCFDVRRLSAITLGVIDANESALKLYKKIGFIITEVKEKFGYYGGNYCNSIRMILKHEE